MSQDLPRSVQDALSVLLRQCLKAAREDEEVARSLRAVVAHVDRELSHLPSSSGASSQDRSVGAQANSLGSDGAHGILTPPGRPRDAAASPGAQRAASEEGHDRAGARGGDARIAEPLAVVVTRARWKAAACRLALQRRENLGASEEEREALESQAASREKSLRGRLAELPDTTAWMLDFPFGKRVSEPGAFEVDKEAALQLSYVAECYETLATGAEIAMELDENGAFRGGPPPAFLYLLAEAQSALLHSLHEAPTRIDSDQRDVFLWLKEQTTRYRIYVDRHMRLDDPADVAGSAGLQDRLRKAAREAVEERAVRRERGQLLSKVRYHVTKIVADPAPLHSEVDSLRAALARWRAAGQQPKDKTLAEALKPLRGYAASAVDSGAKDELYELLAEAGLNPPVDAEADGTREHIVTPAAGSRKGAASDQEETQARVEGDSGRAQVLVSEVRELLAGKTVAVCCPAGEEIDTQPLEKALVPQSILRSDIDMSADPADRWGALDRLLENDDVDLVLLGIRLPTDEYQRFKEACLEKQKPFVRLPGSFVPAAVAHQISRQVGWRLRGRSRDDSLRPGQG